jgi:putative peptide zinc metalloprotease protein
MRTDATGTNATGTSAAGADADFVLPALRPDLRWEAGAGDDQHAALTLIDPLRAAYFRLQWPHSVILVHWTPGTTASAFVGYLNDTLHMKLTASDLAETVGYLQKNQLTAADARGSWRQYETLAAGSKHSLAQALVHNYMFFRIPLFHPQVALQRWLPHISFVFSKAFLMLFVAVMICGGYLVSRQWNDFAAMFHQTEKLPGLAIYGAVLLGLKSIHELGHAFTAVRYGCRVPTMGVAFMLGAPVFYTDTTDSWRLTNRHQRLAIVGAGVAAEFIVAGSALLLWPFLPDGLGREICFAIMTASLTTSVLINLNPFMRYDGYYALSDYLDVPNLQTRAFALARWQMREWLFELGHQPPEVFSPRLQRILTGYALWTWVYRVMLFTAIAALVYAMVLKVLGIFLGLFEIVVFLAMPLFRELKEWWGLRAEIRMQRRGMATGAGLAALAALLFVPWMTHVEAAAVLVAENEAPLHVSAPAQIDKIFVADGQDVQQGELLFKAHSPDIQTKLAKARIELQALMLQSAGLQTSVKNSEQRIVVAQQVMRAREQVASLERLTAQLEIHAAFPGRIVDLDPGLRAGNWQSPLKPMARIVSVQGARVRGMISDTDLSRIAAGASAVFVPEDVSAPATSVKLEYIGPVSTANLTEPVLAQSNGGPIPAEDHNGQLIAAHSGFEVVLRAPGVPVPSLVRGTIRIDAIAEAPITAVWRQVARVLVREQGF